MLQNTRSKRTGMETIADKRCRHSFARGKVYGRVIRDLANWRPLEEAQVSMAGSQQEVTEPGRISGTRTSGSQNREGQRGQQQETLQIPAPALPLKKGSLYFGESGLRGRGLSRAWV